MSEYKIAAVGDRDSVLGFKALGLDMFPAGDAEEAKALLHRLAKENYAIVYLTEGFAQHMGLRSPGIRIPSPPPLSSSPAGRGAWASAWPT